MAKIIKVFLICLCFSLSNADIFESLLKATTSDQLGFVIRSAVKLMRNPSALLDNALRLMDRLYKPELPKLDLDVWWGEDSEIVDDSIRPAPITFNSKMIALLKSKLQTKVPLQPPLIGANISYGFDSSVLEPILNYWGNGYDFKARQAHLNRHPHYVTNIQGLDITFYRISPQSKHGKKVYPILLLHGWPQLHIEFLTTAEMLVDCNRKEYDFVFDVIIPAHPGFAYSQYTNKIGLGSYQMGSIYKKLMSRLGYDKFYLHGGDHGYMIANTMATLFPDAILGFHATFVFTSNPRALVKYFVGALQPDLVVEPQYASRMYPLSKWIYFLMRETGYFHEQVTKPDNLAGLRDSPAGLAAYILHTFVIPTQTFNYTKVNRQVATYDMNDMLDILTIHWDSKDFVTAARLYAECFGYVANPNELYIEMYPTPVPFAPLKFALEVFYFPDDLLREKFPNLTHSSTYDFGGHFAGNENPEILADDIFSAVKSFVKFHGKHN